MGAPDSALPVFSFRPNWEPGITEHLAWMTNTLTSKTAAEQRNSMRLSARRSFDVQIEPVENEHTFLKLFTERFGNQEFMLPLWHDGGELGASASIGATTLTLDTTNREFVNGGMGLLMGADAFSCEAVSINTVSSGSMTLSSATALAWPSGATIHPLRRSWLLDQPKSTRQTDSYDIVPMTFLLSGPCDYDGGSEELSVYGGYPILAPAPDWSATLDLTFARNLPDVDGKTGLRTVGDPAGRSFFTQMHRWFLDGRSDQAAFRRLLSRLRGKQGSLWLPSFTSDLIVAASASPGATHIDVQQCGLVYARLPDHAITTAGEMLHLTGVTVPSVGVERIALGVPLSGALAVGATLSFADVGRLDTDIIDIHHHSNSDGVATVEAPFRTFPDVRDGSGISALPLPTAAMSDDPCGCITDNASGDCNTVTPINTGNMVISIAGPSLPNWPKPADGNDGKYLIVDLMLGLKDFFGNVYLVPTTATIPLVGSHADGTQFDYPDPPEMSVTDHCGNVCNIGITHSRSGSDITINVLIDSIYFRFTDPRIAKPGGVSAADYARNGASYNMIALSVGGTVEEAWVGGASVSTTITLGTSSPAAPAFETTQNGTTGGTVGTVGSGTHAGETYNYMYYACSAFPTGATP